MIEVALSVIVQAKPAKEEDVELKRDSVGRSGDAVGFNRHTTRRYS